MKKAIQFWMAFLLSFLFSFGLGKTVFWQLEDYNCGQDVPRLERRRVPYPQSAGAQSPADCGTAKQCSCPR